jgi:hypothetical protein
MMMMMMIHGIITTHNNNNNNNNTSPVTNVIFRFETDPSSLYTGGVARSVKINLSAISYHFKQSTCSILQTEEMS